MATQSALLTAIEAALTSAGYTPAPSNDPEPWPSWAVSGAGAAPRVLVQVDGADTGGVDGTQTDVVRIDVALVAVCGNPFDGAAGRRASATLARALRVLGEAIGSTTSARLIYQGEKISPFQSGLYLVRVGFLALQYDTY